MSDTAMTVVAIALAATLLFVFPLLATANDTDTQSRDLVESATTQFVQDITNTGKITSSKYQSYLDTITSTGTDFDVNMEVQELDESSSKKTTTAVSSKVGELSTTSKYTSQIVDELNSNGSVILKKGDSISVTAKNKGSTVGQTLEKVFYKITGNNNYKVEASASGMVSVNGN